MTSSRAWGSALGVLVLVFALAGTTSAARDDFLKRKANAMFVFGDSYADTGNRDKNASAWNEPYGITWPGHPTGRFSDGHVSTDYLAHQVFRLPTPTTAAMSSVQTIEYGIDFALGGSGVTYAYGVPPLGTQIDMFEIVLQRGVYSSSVLENSVGYVSNVGNDYSSSFNATELAAVIPQVIEGIAVSVKRLYELGLKNIIVANLSPINCVPSVTKVNNYTRCEDSQTPAIDLHNQLLLQAMNELKELPGANIVVLDQYNAFRHIINNSDAYGLMEKLAPCCRPNDPLTNSCGEKDEQGNKLYTVCSDPFNYVFWDTVHPSQAMWVQLVDLYYQKGFVIGAPNLKTWASGLLSRAPSPAPGPGQGVPIGGAVGQLEAAFNALLSQPNYSMAIGLLQAVDFPELLGSLPEQQVTIFLPNNDAFTKLPASEIQQLYGRGELILVAANHLVRNFYSGYQLWALTGTNLTTVLRTQLPITFADGVLSVGGAQIVRNDLYRVGDEVVIHGIDTLLIPLSLQ